MSLRHMGWIAAVMAGLLAGCGHTRGPEERTEDGLVRVPSRAAGGVYRATGEDFTGYRRLILEPPTIEFTPRWRESHPEVTDADVTRIRNEAVKLFREAVARELVERGPYEFAETPAADALLLVPRIVDLDIPAPDAATAMSTRTYTPGPVKMQITGELRNSATNTLLARVITFEGDRRYGSNEFRLANRVTNAHEIRMAFGKWSRLVNEALNVAKATRPNQPRQGP